MQFITTNYKEEKNDNREAQIAICSKKKKPSRSPTSLANHLLLKNIPYYCYLYLDDVQKRVITHYFWDLPAKEKIKTLLQD